MFYRIICALLLAFIAGCYSLAPVCFAQTYKVGKQEIEMELSVPHTAFDRADFSGNSAEEKEARAFMEANNIDLAVFFDDGTELDILAIENPGKGFEDLSKMPDAILKNEDFKATYLNTYLKKADTKIIRIKKETFEIKNFNNIKYIKIDALVNEKGRWMPRRLYHTIKYNTNFLCRFIFPDAAKILPDKFTDEVISAIRFKEEKTTARTETAAQKEKGADRTIIDPVKQEASAPAAVKNSSGDNGESKASITFKRALLRGLGGFIVGGALFIIINLFRYLRDKWKKQ